MTGTAGQRRIPESFLCDLQLPVPDLHEQRRVAASLDLVATLVRLRQAAISKLDTLALSIFADIFGNVAQNDRKWSEALSLGEVADISSGITKGRRAIGQFTRVPYLAVANVQNMRLDLSTVKEIDATDDEIKRYRLKRDDLLLTEGGDPDKLGRGTLWQDQLPLSIHQNHIFRVRINDGAEIYPVFLNWLVASERGRRYFLRSAKQTTGIASINATQLRQFPLLVPPMELQERFASYVRDVEAQKKLHAAHLAAVSALFASLKHEAFRWEF
jgi:type I restriction enzyme S subunit